MRSDTTPASRLSQWAEWATAIPVTSADDPRWAAAMAGVRPPLPPRQGPLARLRTAWQVLTTGRLP